MTEQRPELAIHEGALSTDVVRRAALADAALNAISSHVAILDADGRIIDSNRAWQQFALANGLPGPADCRGVSYLEVCDRAVGSSSEGAREVAQGIREVLGGQRSEFVHQYPCHSSSEPRFFLLRVLPVDGPGCVRAVAAHENITMLKRAEQELAHKAAELEEANVALRVLLRTRDQDRAELEHRLVRNVNERVMPLLGRVARATTLEEARAQLALLERQILEVVSPFLHQLSSALLALTPQEIQVASLVRDGLSTKHIAEALHVSVDAIDFHRKNIRKKLGLRDKGINLRSYLLSLQDGGASGPASSSTR